MKLSDLKPCAMCGGPLLTPPQVSWHVIRVSTALVNPSAAQRVLGTAAIMGGLLALKMAEIMAPRSEEAVVVLGDLPDARWAEIHVCLDCYCNHFGELPGAIENSGRTPAEGGAA